jgi:predicted enzyme related to lactoylglutathione lyase
VTVTIDAVRIDAAVARERRTAPRVAAWEIHAADVARAGAFYREVFAWRFAPVEHGLWGSVEAQRQVGLDAAVSVTSGPPMLFPYVEVADLEVTLAAVEREGGRTVLPPWQADAATRLALFTDPEGNRVGLIERRR